MRSGSVTLALFILLPLLYHASSFNHPGKTHSAPAVATSLKRWFGVGLIAGFVQLGGLSFCAPPVSAALPTKDGVAVQPDAIEKRRVMEQPTGAPLSVEGKSKTTRLPSGVEYFDVKVGEGPSAEEGRTVQFQWVLRRSNGYFVDASSNYDNEVTYIVAIHLKFLRCLRSKPFILFVFLRYCFPFLSKAHEYDSFSPSSTR